MDYCKGIYYQSGKDGQKKMNIFNALDLFYAKNVKTYPAYVSKYNSKRNSKHYIAVKKLSALLREIT